MVTRSREKLSLTEWAVLGLLNEGPSHGFALSKSLTPSAPIGRIITVRRPLVYRALDRLESSGWSARLQSEPGVAGPERTVYRITPKGRNLLRRWLSNPVDHVRDLRIEFLLKIAFTRRAGREIASLVKAQEDVLKTTLAALTQRKGTGPPAHEQRKGTGPPALETRQGIAADEVDAWRRHNARAVVAFLRDLRRRAS